MSKIFVVLFFQSMVIHENAASPFLNNVASVLTSASGLSSFPQNSENIADLRKIDNHIAKQEIAPLEENENGIIFNEDPQTNNGFVPTLIQKKVSKILKKILYLNMFANSGDKPTSSNDDDFDREQEEFDKEYEQDFGRNVTSVNITGIHDGVLFPLNNTEVKMKLPNEIILFDENGKIENTEEIKKIKAPIMNKRNEKIQDGKFRFSASDIGIFFTELFGSLAGLVYGAAAQFNRPRNQQSLL